MELQIPSQIPNSQYKVLRKIGSTGACTLYAGEAVDVVKPVVLKYFKDIEKTSAEVLQSIDREIALTGRLAHPGIGRFLEKVRSGDDLLMVYEFSRLGTLEDEIQREKNTSISALCGYIFQILVILEYIHEEGIVHRDLKARNFMIGEDKRLRLWDFAHAFDTVAVQPPLGDHLEVSPYWMAPELLDVAVPPTAAADIWSLGCTLIEVISGNAPWSDKDPMEAMRLMMTEQHPPLPSPLPEGMHDLMLKMLQQDSKQRWTAKQLQLHPLIMKHQTKLKAVLQQTSDEFKSSEMRTGERMVGTYRLMEEIGEGAYGVIYRAVNTQNGIPVAIKRFAGLAERSERDRESIRREVEMMKTISHPYIVKYFAAIEEEDALNVVLEIAGKGSLGHLMENGSRPFGETAVMRSYVSQLLRGVGHLHEQGIVHRDIKADNVFLDNYGTIRIGDLGAAVKVNSAVGDYVEGSPYWMAPEVFDVDLPISSPCDVWAIGCTVIELVTGRPPYFGLEPMKAMMKIVQDKHPPIPEGISPLLEDFLMCCFKQDVHERATCADLMEHQWMSVSILEPTKDDFIAMDRVRKYSVEAAEANLRKTRGKRKNFGRNGKSCRQS